MRKRLAKAYPNCALPDIAVGPGYRVYFVQHGQTVVILLAGGDKRTQDRDIKAALELARIA